MEQAIIDKWKKMYGKSNLSDLYGIVNKDVKEFSMNDCDMYLDLYPNGGEKSKADIEQRKMEINKDVIKQKQQEEEQRRILEEQYRAEKYRRKQSLVPTTPKPSPSFTLKDVGEWIGGVVVLILFVGVVMLFVWKPSKKDVPYPPNKYSSCYKCNGTGCVQLGKSDIYCYFYGGLLKIKCSNCRGKGYTRNPLYHGDEYFIVGDDGELYSIDVD